ncbi:MAG: hypothetical protein HY554_17880, partial [Elusimicrobia bacterium]|nr:hypothetical protein [Elusimicrobiota bacterium]
MSSRPGAAAALVLTACACALPFAGAWGQPVAAARELEALADHGRFRDWFDGGH